MAGESGELVSAVCAECGADVRFGAGQSHARCDHCGGGMAVEQGLLLRLRCPGCGGNFYYIDGLLGGGCPYCDAELIALTRDRLLRFVVRAQTEAPAAGAELLLLPFWRLSALYYGFDIGSDHETTLEMSSGASESDGVQSAPTVVRKDKGPVKTFRGRVLDVSTPDPTALAHGVSSLRLRARVFPVEPIGADDEVGARLLPAVLPPDAARERLYGLSFDHAGAGPGSERKRCQRGDLVAESLALLYYPFWSLDGRLVDAVNGVEEQLASVRGPAVADAAPVSLFNELELLELRCSECGAKLATGNSAVIYPCESCGAFFLVGRDGLEPFEARYARPVLSAGGGAAGAAAPGMAWLPFWRVAVEVRYGGRVGRVVADLVGELGVSRMVSPEIKLAEADEPLCYYAAAFGAMRAPRLDFAARDMTRVQPSFEATDNPRGARFRCFYDRDDARRLGYVSWINILPGSSIDKRVRSLRVSPGDATLWYVPFAERGREMVNLVTGLRYDRTAFRGVRH